jgi:hypothetical protein
MVYAEIYVDIHLQELHTFAKYMDKEAERFITNGIFDPGCLKDVGERMKLLEGPEPEEDEVVDNDENDGDGGERAENMEDSNEDEVDEAGQVKNKEFNGEDEEADEAGRVGNKEGNIKDENEDGVGQTEDIEHGNKENEYKLVPEDEHNADFYV